jgi:hypothetical protein
MAIYFTNNTYFKLGTYVMTTVVQSASLNINYDQLEVTAMGDAAHKYLKGLAAHTLSATLYIDQAAIGAGSTRAVLDSLKGTSAAFEIAPNGATASATNPLYAGSVFVNGYTPINGANGEVAMLDITFDLTTDVTITTV